MQAKDDTAAAAAAAQMSAAEGAQWLRRAALQGHAHAANNLGLTYLLEHTEAVRLRARRQVSPTTASLRL